MDSNAYRQLSARGRLLAAEAGKLLDKQPVADQLEPTDRHALKVGVALAHDAAASFDLRDAILTQLELAVVTPVGRLLARAVTLVVVAEATRGSDADGGRWTRELTLALDALNDVRNNVLGVDDLTAGELDELAPA